MKIILKFQLIQTVLISFSSSSASYSLCSSLSAQLSTIKVYEGGRAV